MTTALGTAALVIAAVTGLLWLLLDLAARRRQRDFDRHVEDSLRQVTPNHPSVWRDDL